MAQEWNTQNIVVTGAASGLGRSICTRFVHLDASVRGIDIDKDRLQEVQTVLGNKFIPVICDVANWDDVVQVFSQFPPIDVLVNSAGIVGQTNIKSHETDPAEVERVFRINFLVLITLPRLSCHRCWRADTGGCSTLLQSPAKRAMLG